MWHSMLDLALFDVAGQERDVYLTRLRLAAHDIGFFYLTGHDIDPDLLRQVQAVVLRCFALPAADKQAVAMIHSPHFRGYNRAASERTRGQPDWREQFDLGAERAALPRDATLPATAGKKRKAGKALDSIKTPVFSASCCRMKIKDCRGKLRPVNG